MSSGSSEVLTWLANILTAGGIVDYIVIYAIYLIFYRACKVQKVDRRKLLYFGWAQPYCEWIGLCDSILIVSTYSYTTFLPGWWSTADFLTYYLIDFVNPVLHIG